MNRSEAMLEEIRRTIEEESKKPSYHGDYYPNRKGGYSVIKIQRERETPLSQQKSQERRHLQIPVEAGLDKAHKANDAIEFTSAMYKIITGGDLIGPQYTVVVRALLLLGEKFFSAKKTKEKPANNIQNIPYQKAAA